MKPINELLALLFLATMTVAQEPSFYDDGRPVEPAIEQAAPGDPLPDLFGVPTNSLTTMFASDNQFAGNMFDVEVIGGKLVTIEGFAVNLSAGSTSTISIYFREGSYVGNQSSSAGWTLAGTDNNVIPQGDNIPTPVNIGGIELQPGQVYGFYVTVSSYDSASMLYTDGNAVYADDNLQITAGIGKGDPDFTGSTFDPRIWNGTIYYSTSQKVPLSGWAIWILGGLITMFVLLRIRRVL